MIVMAMCIGLLIWVLRSRNVTLPRMPSIRLPQSSAAAVKKPATRKKVVEEEDEDEYEEEEEEIAVKEKKRGGETGSVVSLLRSTIKDSVEKKLQEKKESQKVITFPKDKPSYDITLLEGSTAVSFSADESYLMQKATALQSKLEEFSIPVEIK